MFVALDPTGDFVTLIVRVNRPTICQNTLARVHVSAITRDRKPRRYQGRATKQSTDALEARVYMLDFWRTYYISSTVHCKNTRTDLAISVPFYTGPGGIFST